jgi:hypothetical protein
MSNITAQFVSASNYKTGREHIKEKTDYTNSPAEYPAKAILKKRKIFEEYIKERDDTINKLTFKIDFKKWNGYSEEALNHRKAYNDSWIEINKHLVKINKKYIPLFLAEKIKCIFCGKPKHAEDLIQGHSAFININPLLFCNDDHLIEFNKLEKEKQEKLAKKFKGVQ